VESSGSVNSDLECVLKERLWSNFMYYSGNFLGKSPEASMSMVAVGAPVGIRTNSLLNTGHKRTSLLKETVIIIVEFLITHTLRVLPGLQTVRSQQAVSF
jgi:hypothetical protein